MLNSVAMLEPVAKSQVHRLRAGLPTGVRVGTVDKFQGLEEPLVFALCRLVEYAEG